MSIEEQIMCWCLGRTLEILAKMWGTGHGMMSNNTPRTGIVSKTFGVIVYLVKALRKHTRNVKQCPCPFSFDFATKLYSGLKIPCTIEQHMLPVTSRCCDHFAKTSPNDHFAKTSRDVWYGFVAETVSE